MSTRIDRMQRRIRKIKDELLNLGEMRPGALSKQYNVCGKSGCRCKDPDKPKKHGPYYQLSFSHQGKSTTQFVKKHLVAEVRTQLRNYIKFRKLTNEWVALAVKIAAEKKKLE